MENLIVMFLVVSLINGQAQYVEVDNLNWAPERK